MHRLFLLLALAACAGSPPPPHQASVPVHVQLLALNDFHGHLEPPPGTVRLADGTVPAGGGAWLAAQVARLRAEEPDTLVVGAGDLIGASPLPSALGRDEPSISLMDALGLDVSSVGNHEFDKGADELLRLQRGGCRADEPACKHPFPGARFSYLAANVVDRSGKTLLPGTLLKKVGGATVGFIGVVLRETPSVVTPSGVAGLSFGDEADAVNAAVPKLREAGADAVVVLIHQGAAQAPGSPPGECRGLSGPLVDLAQRFRGVDVIVSGHTHQAYVCPDLGGALATSAGSFGRFVTRIELELDPVQHRVLSRQATQVPVTHDVAPDAQAKSIVDQAVADAAPLASRRVGRLAATLARSLNEAGESTLGSAVADAHLAATRKSGGAAIAFTNPGGLRADLPSGDVTYAQTFAAQPFGNMLVTFTLTGAQVAALLEQQWLGSRPRILQPSANVSYAWSAAAPAGSKVVPGSLTVDGRALAPDARVRVTVNGFLGAGGDGFSVFADGRERVGGPPDLDALVEYLRPTLEGAPLPRPSGPRITRAP